MENKKLLMWLKANLLEDIQRIKDNNEDDDIDCFEVKDSVFYQWLKDEENDIFKDCISMLNEDSHISKASVLSYIYDSLIGVRELQYLLYECLDYIDLNEEEVIKYGVEDFIEKISSLNEIYEHYDIDFVYNLNISFINCIKKYKKYTEETTEVEEKEEI